MSLMKRDDGEKTFASLMGGKWNHDSIGLVLHFSARDKVVVGVFPCITKY